MSSQRRRRRSAPPSPSPALAPAMVSRLWALLHPGEALPAAHQVLEEACAYIRRLQAEADGLAE